MEREEEEEGWLQINKFADGGSAIGDELARIPEGQKERASWRQSHGDLSAGRGIIPETQLYFTATRLRLPSALNRGGTKTNERRLGDEIRISRYNWKLPPPPPLLHLAPSHPPPPLSLLFPSPSFKSSTTFLLLRFSSSKILPPGIITSITDEDQGEPLFKIRKDPPDKASNFSSHPPD